MTTEVAIVEFANDAFYMVFNSRDLEQMSAMGTQRAFYHSKTH